MFDTEKFLYHLVIMTNTVEDADAKGWKRHFVEYANHTKKRSVIWNILDVSQATRDSIVSACIGGVVIVLALFLARPSFILSEPACLYDSPKLNVLKVVFVFTFVAGLLFVLDAHEHVRALRAGASPVV